uniref:Reverse transcriptase domain-containing protein n=1 Tax=Haemonchus contortus TaxID=6289 RepID=A0A7I4Z1I1_HAECO
MDILGISEVRWTGQDCMRSDEKTILFSGPEERHERGVGIVLSKRAVEALVGWRPLNARIITAPFVTRHTRITVVQDIVDDIPRRDLKLIIGDFNAKLSLTEPGSSEQLGHSLLHKRIHKETWCSPDGKTRNEIDYICISKKWRTSLRDIRVLRGADVGSDHHLLGASIKHKLKQARPFAVEKLKNPATTACFSLVLRNRFAVLEEAGTLEEEWTSVKRAIKDCAQKVVGRRRGKRKEQWIQGSTWEKIDERKHWKLRREQAKNENELEEATSRYAELDRIVNQSCRRNEKVCIVNELIGSSKKVNLPINDSNGRLLLNADEQKERWLEHFRNILNQPEPQRTYCSEGMESANELEVDVGSITPEETIEAIRCLRSGRASGIDEIPAELLKAGGSTMVKKLTELYNRCWNGGEVPEDWRKGVIVKLPKKEFGRTVKIGEQTAAGVHWLNDERLTDLDFADDIAHMAEDKDGLQKVTDALNDEAYMTGLLINARTKEEALHKTGNSGKISSPDMPSGMGGTKSK